MLKIDKNGMLIDGRILPRRYMNLEQGALTHVNAIVVHQTDSPTDQSTFNTYANPKRKEGAHFLIGVMGTIYQTASIRRRCYHVGALRSRCMVLGIKNCSDPAYAALKGMSFGQQKSFTDQHERKKPYPERYPMNADSVGIEIVGKSLAEGTYDAIHNVQQHSLTWLVAEIAAIFSLGTEDDVYRHPDLSYKNAGEAAAADWTDYSKR